MPPIIALFLSMSMYLNAIFNTKKMRDVLLFIKNNHNYYANRPEKLILRYYDVQGRKITLYYALYVYTTVVAYITIPAISLLIDFIIPSNHSEEKSFPIELDYGVDTQQYFYYLFIHSYMTIAMIANLIASCDTTYMLYAQHGCALFAIVSYELRTVHILDASSLINLKDYRLLESYKNTELLPEEEKKICTKLFLCIKEYQNAIRYCNLVESLFAKSIFVQLFFNVVCLSIAGVETVMKLGNAADTIRFGSFTFAQAAHIFVLCLPGQRLLNHSEEVYNAACEAMWYIFPKRCRNLYKFLLARTLVFSKITAFKVATMSMETFLAIIQTAMSYFTVLLSTT
ncbi:odorant receptor 13a-like [Bombus pyrosoma]|uniref:odorant receptor 13a-like n=1 Tax=Bombus pyrosoma TaxID=396416 RepID=UPI001CB8908B|nr:odorant receptor 13a-like [Bombus pyrosoma]